MKTKKITKKRIKKIEQLAIRLLNKAKGTNRILSLYKRCDKIQYLKNVHLNKNSDFKIENYRPLKISTMIKAMPWYKDQVDERRWAIVSHRTFCCPLSGEILDMNDSFFVNNNGKKEIISTSGFEMIFKDNQRAVGAICT